jgi:hypothetical protein
MHVTEALIQTVKDAVPDKEMRYDKGIHSVDSTREQVKTGVFI